MWPKLADSKAGFDAVLDRAAAIVTETVAREGAFTFTNHTGMIRALPC